MNIGIDIVAIKKFQDIRRDDYVHWSHIFAKEEWGYAFVDAGSALHLAGIFAAKEAAMKATGDVGVKNYQKFIITHAKTGAPSINMKGAQVSISHNQDAAVAVVITSH